MVPRMYFVCFNVRRLSNISRTVSLHAYSHLFKDSVPMDFNFAVDLLFCSFFQFFCIFLVFTFFIFIPCPGYCYLCSYFDPLFLCFLTLPRYGQSPFEYSLGESGGSLQLAVMSGQVKWPDKGKGVPYPDSFRQLATKMMHVDITSRPFVPEILRHLEELEFIVKETS